MSARSLATLTCAMLLFGCGGPSLAEGAASPGATAPGARHANPHRHGHVPPPAPRAPGGPPLVAPGAAGLYVEGANESSASAAPSGGDVLTLNGLTSPLCHDLGVLSATGRRNCRASGFSASPYPTGDYAVDVNINTGLGQVSNDASVMVQDAAQHVWMALVAVTHALVVMFEWCFSLNVLGGQAMSRVSGALHDGGVHLTQPWLAFALPIAAGLAAYHGLIRRRMAQAVAQTLASLLMVLCALWAIADPSGTVGALQRWADEGSASAFAISSTGAAASPQAALASGMGQLFDAVVTAPWCYLEFGNVGWCADPSRLDPRLRAAAGKLVQHMAPARPPAFGGRPAVPSGCKAGCGGTSRAEALSASLLQGAGTNGQLFLALPANEQQRNSSKEDGTLLNVLCGGGPSADECSGPTAAQAEFRSERGTDGRIMGLAAIVLGALGMLLVFGLLGVRLLMAAATTLLYLLLAPAIAPAAVLGDAGRSLFRAWAQHLLAASVSKLAYAFLLGVLLSVTRTLMSLTVLGWGAQWCLVSVFWWTAFAKRRQAAVLLAGRWRVHIARPSPDTPLWRTLQAVEISRLHRRRRPALRPFGRTARQ